MLTEGTPMLTWLMMAFILLDYVFESVLDYLNARSWDLPTPPELTGLYDEQRYRKARSYHQAKARLSRISSTFSTILMLAFLYLKGFAWMHLWVDGVTAHPVAQALLFFGAFAVLSDIIGLPFEWYNIFVIEEKFGFNKMTWKTYLSDKLKGYLIGAVIGGTLLAAFAWFYQQTGALFWLYAWGLFTAFTLFFATFYTSLIVPLFNQLQPLEAGSLREKIEEYARKVSFPLHNIFIIDGSKRSTKANAYFSGLGSKKTIVLYDTLLKDHTEEELISILAHEVGHYKKKHIHQGMVISVLQTGLLLYILSVFIKEPMLTQALGLNSETAVFPIGLVAFSLLYSPISIVTGLMMNIFSRKNEFEADRFAKESTGTGEHLISSLKKLSANNLSNLQPDRWYVFFHYSHPPLLERVRALMK